MYVPPLLKEKIASAKWEKNTVGMSGASVYKLTGINDGGNAYLKTVRHGEPETLQEEMEKLKWLSDKAIVPQVLHFETDECFEYLLLSELVGKNLLESNWGNTNPIELGKSVAESLLAIHQININDCPFNETLPEKLRKAWYRVEKGFVDPNDFDPEYQRSTPEQLFSILERNQPIEEPLVFTHGDFSLANIISRNQIVTGFVDWGRSGVSDPHKDLAIAIRSLRHHVTEDAANAFIDTYGKNKVDFEKVKYYILMDELF